MKRESIKRNRIDFLFPLILFFVFSLCAVIVILFSARVYRKVVEESSSQNTAATAAAYITEKVHQSDVKNMISVGNAFSSDFGSDCLVLSSEHGDDTYETIIYYYEGSLCELFAKSGVAVNPESGAKLFELSEAGFSMEENLLHITLKDSKGSTSDCSVLIHSN